MNLYSFLRKKHKKPFLGAFFAVVFLSTFFAFNSKAEASLNDYETLFSGKSPAASLKLLKLVSPMAGSTTTLQPDIKFNFQGSFPFVENNGAHEKTWYWKHITDFDNNYVFVLRICDANATGEETCVFSVVPYQTETYPDSSILCPASGTCIPPDQTGAVSPKIYHYTAKTSGLNPNNLETNNPIQNDKFNVSFPVTSLAFLKAEKQLDTPIPLKDLFIIGNPTTYKADIWYCSKKMSGETLPTNDPSPDIRIFKNLCGDNLPYFKMAESATFKMPQTVPEALAQTEETVGQVDTTASDSNAGSTLPVCGILNGALRTSGSFMGCIAYVGYGIYQITAWIAGILGRVMDFFIGYSISDESYRAGVVVTGWKLVRDISNIFFIIILIWTGFATVFNFGGISMKKIVPALIINALIINFSLFGTQVIIDISNITARLFYNTMSVCDGKCEYYPAPRDKEIKNPNTRTTGGYKPLSEKIVDSFDPQKIFKPSTLSSTATLTKNTREDKATGGFNASGINNNIETSKTLGIYDSDYAIYFLIVSIIAAIIMLAMAKMFFGVMFMFVGRVVGLYMTMIFSPFAVLTRGGMPLVGNIKELSWDTWLKDLTNYALLAPIFVFFLYIIYAFINSDFLSILNLRESDGFMDTVITIAVPMIIIYMLIAQGVGIAKKYAGKAGEMIQGFASKATGLIGGAALGVGALTGARVIGGAAKAVNESKAGRWLRDKAPDSAIARMSLRGLDKAAKSSWDVRQSELGKSGLKSLGINSNPKGLNALAGIGLGLGTDQRKGGFEADVKRRKEDKVKTGKLFEEKMSDPQIDAYNKRQNKKYEDKKNKIEEEALMKKDNLNKKELEDLKKTNPTSYNTKKAEALAATPSAQTEIDNIAKPKEMKSSKEVNTDRKKQYVSNLASGSFLGKVPVVGTLVGAGVRDRGDQEASKEIKKEVEKGEKEAIKKAATEKLVSDLGDKLEKLEGKDGLGGELKKFNENLSAILTEEASQHGDFRGRDIKTLTSEEKFELVERRETRMAGRLGVLEADHAKAIEEYKKNNTPQNKANLVNAVKAMKEEEKRISKARDLMEKSSKTEGDIVKTKKDKLQAEERLENMEYRKERKESEEKKNKGGDTKEKPAAEAKPKDETK